MNFDELDAARVPSSSVSTADDRKPVDFATRLDRAIKDSKLSVPAFASKVGVGAGYVYKLLGRTVGKKIESPSLEKVAEFARHLNVPAAWLAFGEGAMRDERATGDARADALFFARRVMHARELAIETVLARYQDVAEELTAHDWVVAIGLEERRMERNEIARLSAEREALHRKVIETERRARRKGSGA